MRTVKMKMLCGLLKLPEEKGNLSMCLGFQAVKMYLQE